MASCTHLDHVRVTQLPESVAVLRMVVKENFSRDMAEMLGEDIEKAIAKMDGRASAQAQAAGSKQRRIC